LVVVACVVEGGGEGGHRVAHPSGAVALRLAVGVGGDGQGVDVHAEPRAVYVVEVGRGAVVVLDRARGGPVVIDAVDARASDDEASAVGLDLRQ
jgi:hypothetical protein